MGSLDLLVDVRCLVALKEYLVDRVVVQLFFLLDFREPPSGDAVAAIVNREADSEGLPGCGPRDG